jgi:thiamine pyrophosphate-dependent acetolactate synthase large subunit-like protein
MLPPGQIEKKIIMGKTLSNLWHGFRSRNRLSSACTGMGLPQFVKKNPSQIKPALSKALKLNQPNLIEAVFGTPGYK